MNKSDARIKKTAHVSAEPETKSATGVAVTSYPAPHPCDDTDKPEVPDKPIPNPDRPKRKGDKKDELEYTNGVQKVGNTVSVKVHPDSTNYMRTYKDGLSIKYLINKLECVRKSMDKLKDSLNELKEEVQPAGIIETIVNNSTDFQTTEDGYLELKLGNGLGRDGKGYIGVELDKDTLAFDENGKIMTVWGDYSTRE